MKLRIENIIDCYESCTRDKMIIDQWYNIFELVENTIYKYTDHGLEYLHQADKELKDFIINKVYEDLPF